MNPASLTCAGIPPKRCNEERVTCVPSIIIIITGTAPNNIHDNCTVVFLRHVKINYSTGKAFPESQQTPV